LIIFTYKQSQKKRKSQFQPISQIVIFILTYPNSLPIIIHYSNQRKKHHLDFKLKAILHFNFENHFYLWPATCADVNLGDNGNYQFYSKAVNKRLQNGRPLNDPFVGKLYHFGLNHASSLRLNKKENYLANQVI
jgi:hypothetical protein